MQATFFRTNSPLDDKSGGNSTTTTLQPPRLDRNVTDARRLSRYLQNPQTPPRLSFKGIKYCDNNIFMLFHSNTYGMIFDHTTGTWHWNETTLHITIRLQWLLNCACDEDRSKSLREMLEILENDMNANRVYAIPDLGASSEEDYLTTLWVTVIYHGQNRTWRKVFETYQLHTSVPVPLPMLQTNENITNFLPRANDVDDANTVDRHLELNRLMYIFSNRARSRDRQRRSPTRNRSLSRNRARSRRVAVETPHGFVIEFN